MDQEESKVNSEIIACNLKEIKEDPNTVETQIELFRQLVSGIEGLVARQDKTFLLKFLRTKKFDYERALELFTNYYKVRANDQAFFAKAMPSLVKPCYEMNTHTVLDGRDNLGRRVNVFRFEHWDPSKCSYEELLACLIILLEYYSEEEETQICGVSGILDFKGFSLNHMRHISIANIRRLINATEKTFPVRFKTIHIVNEGFIARTILTVTLPFLNKKMRQRVVIHGNNFAGLHEHISPSILPLEFMGELPAMDSMQFYNKLLQHEDHFAKLQKYGFVKD